MPIPIIGRMTPEQACQTHDALMLPTWKQFKHLHMLTVFVQPGALATAACTGTFSDPNEAIAVLQSCIDTLRAQRGATQETRLIVPR